MNRRTLAKCCWNFLKLRTHAQYIQAKPKKQKISTENYPLFNNIKLEIEAGRESRFFSFSDKKYRGNFRVKTNSSETLLSHYCWKFSINFQIDSLKIGVSMHFLRNHSAPPTTASWAVTTIRHTETNLTTTEKLFIVKFSIIIFIFIKSQ